MTDETQTTPTPAQPQAGTQIKKGLLRSIRDALRWLLHMALVPIVGLCKGLATVFQHWADELGGI